MGSSAESALYMCYPSGFEIHFNYIKPQRLKKAVMLFAEKLRRRYYVLLLYPIHCFSS
jgi:hypothetical protein